MYTANVNGANSVQAMLDANNQIAKNKQSKTQNEDKKVSLEKTLPSDKITLSLGAQSALNGINMPTQAVLIANEEEMLSPEQLAQKKTLDAMEALKTSKAMGKAQKDATVAMSRCLTISRRIMNGDRVPAKDEKYLLDNNPKMYMAAMSLRQQNDKPKDYKSVLDKEDEKNPMEKLMENSEGTVGEIPETPEIPEIPTE